MYKTIPLIRTIQY